jgi:hypothetical protein
MNRSELEDELTKAHARHDSYWLHGGLPSERHTLEQRVDSWAVYYSERGQRTSEQTFRTENAACEELLRRVLSEPANRPRPPEQNP